MPLGFLLKAVAGCDYDTDELYKSPQHAAYIKNICLDLNENSGTADGSGGTEGDNAGVFTPIESTEILCPIPLPEGFNYCIGYYESKETNEGYVFVYNSLSNHSVYVIDGYTSRCQMIKQGSCLGFKLLPEHFISLGRCVLQTVVYFNKASGQEERRKYLIFTDNTPPIKFISVTDAIATKGFTLPFFKSDNCPECDLLSLGISTPDSCISITPVVRPAGDNRDNLIEDKMLQFRVKFIDVWARETEHGIISDPWYQSGACLSTGQPRCLDLAFDAGCSTIQKIQIEFRIWNANDPELSVPTDWLLHDTIDKYDQRNPLLEFWERTVNPDLRFNASQNQIVYTFCADKGTTAIPFEETKRNFNPIPLTASSVFTANKSIGTANHWRGFAPLNVSLLEQVKFSTEKPDPRKACTYTPRTITVYGHLRSLYEETDVTFRKQADKIVYGTDESALIFEFQQFLAPGQEGVIGYFAGTSEYVISTQCRYNKKTGEVVEVGMGDFYKGETVPNIGPALTEFWRNFIPIQRWKFVGSTPGKKIFRVAAPQATPQDDYQKTSFPSAGTSKFPDNTTYLHQDQYEIHIDQCEGDVDLLLKESFIMCDLVSSNGGTRKITNVTQGYLYEDEISRIPVESAYIGAPSHTRHPLRTDHNGFYWAMSDRRNWHTELFAQKKCAKVEVARTRVTVDAPGERFIEQKLYMYSGTSEYDRQDRISIRGRVALCSSPTSGVKGVLVMLTGGSTAVTDENGNYTIIAHDNGGDAPPRQDRIKFAQKGVCLIGRCDDECSVCFDDVIFSAPGCSGMERIFTVNDLGVSMRETSQRGPQNGGRYELGIVPYYNIGQPAGVQRIPVHAVDIPTIGETGTFGFSRIKYTIPAGVRFPPDVRYFTFAISRNLNFDNFLTWAVEKVELVDNTGNRNQVNPSQIKLYYSGLNEYNLQNGLATNSVWQFLDDKESPVVGDRVEFIINGDGKIFPTRISALVKFDKEGSYILINYQEELKDLKDGAQIKLLRPRVGTNSHLFYEQCRVVRVRNGLIDEADREGYINYFDSYMVARQIPVPFYDKDNKKDLAKSQLKTIPYAFEHHSPSDFWGDHAASRGRVHVVNPFENRLSFPTEIALSKALANDGVLNGLSYFEQSDSTEYDEQEWGSITCVIPNIGSLTVICQQNNFEVGMDENTVRMDKQGNLIAVPLSSRLGRPDRKKGSSYGCHQQDINTIREHKGMVMFLDRSESALVALYGEAQDVSVNGFKGHLKDKIKHMLRYNGSGDGWIIYFHASFDSKRGGQYLLSTFRVPRVTNPVQETKISGYVNQLRYKSIEDNETLGYDPFQRGLKLAYSFTPEYFGSLAGHVWDNQLLSFKNGQPYMHHKRSRPENKGYWNFYGEVCEGVYEPVLNTNPGAVKRFLWTEVLSRDQLFFCDLITTESGQRSRLLTTWWHKRENFFTADFKMNLLTYQDPNVKALTDSAKAILEGEPLTGKWIRARYIARPPQGATEAKYFEMDGVHIFIFQAQKSGT